MQTGCFLFLIYGILSTGNANDMLSLTSLLITKGQTQFFFQEANAILIVWPGLNDLCLRIVYK